MVSVGDSPAVHLYSTEGGYRKVGEFSGARDAGFSVAWNSASTVFASASQDGLVCVWDVRSSRMLAKLKSSHTMQVKKV
jgi:WD40 repeat protein